MGNCQNEGSMQHDKPEKISNFNSTARKQKNKVQLHTIKVEITLKLCIYIC